MAEKRTNWPALLIGGAVTAMFSGGTWMVSSVVHGREVQAVLERDINDHKDKLQDHELRTRSLEGVVQQQQMLQKVAQEQLNRLITLEEERSRKRK